MVRKNCVIKSGEDEFEFDDLSVLDLTISCENPLVFCTDDSSNCLEVKCEDPEEFYIVSFDKEKGDYLIEPSNPDDYKYYMALLERRKNNPRRKSN